MVLPQRDQGIHVTRVTCGKEQHYCRSGRQGFGKLQRIFIMSCLQTGGRAGIKMSDGYQFNYHFRTANISNMYDIRMIIIIIIIVLIIHNEGTDGWQVVYSALYFCVLWV